MTLTEQDAKTVLVAFDELRYDFLLPEEVELASRLLDAFPELKNQFVMLVDEE